MIAAQQRVFLKPEEPGEVSDPFNDISGKSPKTDHTKVQGGLVCTSLPGLEPGLSENLYFACTCGLQGTRATFSLAR